MGLFTGTAHGQSAAPARPRRDLAAAHQPAHQRGWPSPLTFFCLTFVWSWVFWGLAIASGRSYTAFPTVVLFVIGSIGPSLVGLLLTLRASGRQGARGLLKRAAGLGRITLRWWAAMVGLAALPNLGALLLAAGMHGKAPDLSKALELAGTPLALLSIAAFALAAGVAEEGGWRGFALERLRFRRSALAASVVIGVAWSLWHLPLFFLDGTYQNELGFGSAAFWWFMAEKLPLAVLFTWIYEGSGGLVAAAIAFHAIGNIVGDVFPAGGGARWVSLAILVGLAGAIAARWRDRTPHDHAGQQVEPL